MGGRKQHHDIISGFRSGGSNGGDKLRRSAHSTGPVDLLSSLRDRAKLQRSSSKGSDQIKKRVHVFPVEQHSFVSESRHGALNRSCQKSIKMLITEEMSKGAESRRSSPNLVARLMGLETLPPQVVNEQNRRGCMQTGSFGSEKNHVVVRGRSHHMSDDEEQEFKDVYEVMETSEAPRMINHPAGSGKPSSQPNEIDMAYIRQKFSELKRLSTDNAVSSCEELDDALEVLDANKDLFLKFLEEPNTLFAKHLHNLRFPPPSPHPRRITILKSSKGLREMSEGCCVPEKKTESYRHLQKDASNSFLKYESPLVNQHPEELSSSKLKHSCKTEGYSHPTRIVVLKPNLNKTGKPEHGVSSSLSSQEYNYGHGMHRELRHSGIQELSVEALDRQKEHLLRRPRNSREIAHKMTAQMRGSTECSTRNRSPSGFRRTEREKVACMFPSMDDLYGSQESDLSAGDFDECSFNSSPYSSESSLSREARKRLSDHWKMTHSFQEVQLVESDSSSLAEMLASTQRVVSGSNFHSGTSPNIADGNLHIDETTASCGCQSGICGGDDWKYVGSRNLARSTSPPTSFNLYQCAEAINKHHVSKRGSSMIKAGDNQYFGGFIEGNYHYRLRARDRNSKYHSRSSNKVSGDEEEIKPSEREIHVHEVLDGHDEKNIAEEKAMIPKQSEINCHENNHLDGPLPYYPENAHLSVLGDKEQTEEQSLTEALVKTQGIPSTSENFQVSISSGCYQDQLSEVTKDIDGPSPVSVLVPLQDEKTSSGCFDDISANLKELRLQLQHLEMDPEDSIADDLEGFIVSDYDMPECHPPFHTVGLPYFKDDTDREYSYLVDVLIVLGVQHTSWHQIYEGRNFIDHPGERHAFDQLEKKYSMMNSWPLPDRKLLFDLVNCILAEEAAYCNNLHHYMNFKRIMPKATTNDLVEYLCQMVSKRRKELKSQLENVLEPSWLDLSYDIDVLGKEMEDILTEELVEDLFVDMVA